MKKPLIILTIIGGVIVLCIVFLVLTYIFAINPSINGHQCLGDCPEDGINKDNGDEEDEESELSNVNITITSAPDITCTFERSDLWDPQIPWDGSYICNGSITFNFNGLTFPEDRTLTLNVNPTPDYSQFSLYDAQAGVPLNEVTFYYDQPSDFYFESVQPPCPLSALQGELTLYELIPNVGNPFPEQSFDINIPAVCQ